MNRLMVMFSLLAIFALPSIASAEKLDPCNSNMSRGTVCSIGTEVKTACGGGVYLDGRVSNAGQLEDACFSAQGNRQKEEAAPAPIKLSPE